MVKRIEKISGINDKMRKKPQQEWVVYKKKKERLPKIEKKNKEENEIDIIV